MANEAGAQGTSGPAPLTVAHVLFSFGTGGLEKGVATLVCNASPSFRHIIVCMGESGASERLLPPGTAVVPLRKRSGNSPVFLLRLSRELRRLRPDVVHTRNWSGMDGIVGARLAGLRRVVHGEHGWGVDDPEGMQPRRVFVRRTLARWVREYTCVSQAMVPWLKKTVRVRRPVTQIYNGIDTERYRPFSDRGAAREALGLPPDAFVVGTVGRLDPIKDHGTLIRAFAALRREVSNARLLLVGDGPERQALETIIGDGVQLLGSREDVPSVMNAMDVFVLPSRNEGISNTILEAMATGLPVVATAVGGNPELVVDGVTGRLLPVGDAEAVTVFLTEYAKHPLLAATHGRAGRSRTLQEFSTNAMVAAYEALYARVGSRPAGHCGFGGR